MNKTRIELFEEAEERLSDLREDLARQRERVTEAHKVFLQELEALASILRESERVANETETPVAKALNRNKLAGLTVSGQHQWTLSLEEINQILRV